MAAEAVVQQERILNVSIAASPATWQKIVESLSRSSKEVAKEIVILRAAAAEKEQKLRRENATNARRMGISRRIAEARKLRMMEVKVSTGDQRYNQVLTKR